MNMKRLFASLGMAMMLTTVVLTAKTAGSINGVAISVEEANSALKGITGGKMTWSELPAEGKKELLEMMAPSRLALLHAKKDLNAKEKDSALTEYWMKKEMSKVKVSEQETQEAYDRIVKIAKQSKVSKPIPSYENAKKSIELQLRQEKVVKSMMKNANIKIN